MATVVDVFSVKYVMRLKKELIKQHIIQLQDSILSEARDEVEERVENLEYRDKNVREYSL
jgi:hypothetical protein